MRELPHGACGLADQGRAAVLLLEQADDAHVMYHLPQERRQMEGSREPRRSRRAYSRRDIRDLGPYI